MEIGPILRLRLASTICFSVLAAVAQGQQPATTSQDSGLTQKQIQRRIFEGEQQMISSLIGTAPRLETYLQSLSPQTKAERPIDDAYFLSKVDFSRGYEESGQGRRGYQTFFFGGPGPNRTVRVNNGRRWKLYPDGFLDMLFVDLEDFDGETYNLSYIKAEPFGGALCLTYFVTPKDVSARGKFRGRIWVESSTFKIIRINGTFKPTPVGFWRRTVGGDIPIYFSFDSVRQEVAPGTWMPWYSYLDEDRTWKQLNHNGETDFHYRGHIFIWGYRNTAERSGKPYLLSHLDDEKLLANPDIVERGLNVIVNKIAVSNNLNLPDIECRVLLTTPVEIFHSGHTVIVSRGLLNLLPDDSVLPLLLAREISEMTLLGRANPDVRGPADVNAEEWSSAVALATKAGYSDGIFSTCWLFAQLAERSKQVPNLVQSRFGASLLLSSAPPLAGKILAQGRSGTTLTLRGKYTIDAWDAKLQIRPEGYNDTQTAGASQLQQFPRFTSHDVATAPVD
jgi:hypothetical protein